MKLFFKKFTILFISLFSFFTFSNQFIPEHFGVPIEQAMGLRKEQITKAFRSVNWMVVKNLYETYAINNLEWSETPRIPKIVHHIWLGGPLPEKCKVLRETWMEMHPDWEFILWTEKEIDEFGLKNRKIYDETSNYGSKSDIARYEILYRIGGLYVDTDFECTQKFDVFHHCCDFYAGLAAWEVLLAYNGLIGAAPGHPILKACIDNLHSFKGKKDTPEGIQGRTGPFFFTSCFFKGLKVHAGPSVLFPANYFYPWPHYERDKRDRKSILKWVKPETFAIHHWHCSWSW